jgi:hypothetical protein
MDSPQNKLSKIIIKQEDGLSDLIITESLWAKEKGFNLYEIDNIPFYAFLYSLGDLVQTEAVFSELIVKSLVTASGNSTIRLNGEVDGLKKARKVLQENRCDTEMSISDELLTINVPKSVHYVTLLNLVIEQCNAYDLDYEEACVSEHHAHSA